MAPHKARTRVRLVATASGALVVGLAILSPCSSERGNLRLPVGNRPPAICLGERHGLILASDGSLWTWGADLLGWPVLGLGKVMKTTTLRQIGHDTNWVSISAGETHNLAVKADGTLWTWGCTTPGRFTMPMPIHTPVLAAPGHDWKQAAAGGIHSIALKRAALFGPGAGRLMCTRARARPRILPPPALELAAIGGAFLPAPAGGARA
jgi:Regulator of chromosome condensation (RCC1) repeat